MENIDFRQHIIRVTEKGGLSHTYHISQEGIKAIQDYLVHEKGQDFKKWDYNALFLSAATNPRGNGKMTAQVVNKIWNEVCQAAGVIGKTPHSARHAMGRHIIEKTGNVAAVQRQLGHRNATYSMQYARITGDELKNVLNDRDGQKGESPAEAGL
jgi:site-specific recombinase XerD